MHCALHHCKCHSAGGASTLPLPPPPPSPPLLHSKACPAQRSDGQGTPTQSGEGGCGNARLGTIARMARLLAWAVACDDVVQRKPFASLSRRHCPGYAFLQVPMPRAKT